MLECIIHREKWHTGRYKNKKFWEFAGGPGLLNRQGFRCCLGWLGKACNLPDNVAKLFFAMPHSCVEDCSWPSKLFEKEKFWKNVNWEYVFSEINDAPDIEDEIREAWIIEGFARILNVKVIFTGKYPV